MINNSGMLKRVSLLAAVLMLVLCLAGCKIQYVEDEETTSQAQESTTIPDEVINLRLWYSDDTLTSYILKCAKEYEQANNNVNISISLISESDYITTLTEKAFSGESVDLYIVNNDYLEQLRLAGIADQNYMSDIYSEYNYSVKALNACTYNGSLIAYPLFFDTTFMIYNKEYIDNPMMSHFEELKLFADEYEVEAGSKLNTLFTCNLNDIFFNYGFLGSYLPIGGPCGDDKTIAFDINDEVVAAVGAYSALIDYFFINMDEVDYYDCINSFESGASAMTIADTQMYERIISSCENVGVLPFLDFSEEIKTAPLSITTGVVVNPFSKNANVAASFAKYMTYTNADYIYEETGRIACRRLNYDDDNINQIYASYEKSVPKLKIMYNEEFYALLEVTMHLIAKHEDDVQSLSAVSNYIKTQWK